MSGYNVTSSLAIVTITYVQRLRIIPGRKRNKENDPRPFPPRRHIIPSNARTRQPFFRREPLPVFIRRLPLGSQRSLFHLAISLSGSSDEGKNNGDGEKISNALVSVQRVHEPWNPLHMSSHKPNLGVQ